MTLYLIVLKKAFILFDKEEEDNEQTQIMKQLAGNINDEYSECVSIDNKWFIIYIIIYLI